MAAPERNSIDDLVNRLSEDLQPVRRLPNVPVSSMVLFAVCAFFIALIVLFTERVHALEMNLVSFANLVSLLAIACGGALLTASARVPGGERRGATLAATAGLLLCALLIGIGISLENGVHPMAELSPRSTCAESAVILGLVPLVLGGIFLRFGAPTRRIEAAAGLVALSIGLAATAVSFICPDVGANHLLFAHFLAPFAFLAFFALLFARRAFRW